MKYKQIGLITEFADSLKIVGEESNCNSLINYANKLHSVISSFDFERIITTLIEYDIILDRVLIDISKKKYLDVMCMFFLKINH